MRHCVVLFILLPVLVLLVPGPASAAILIVNQASGPYYDIKSAISAAAHLDTVRVMPGTYTGAITPDSTSTASIWCSSPTAART